MSVIHLGMPIMFIVVEWEMVMKQVEMVINTEGEEFFN